VSKLTGDHEADVARLKGEVEAIETAQIKAKCKTLDSRAATPSASPSNAKE
jgi:DNA-binding Xre family transcriptional regulator